MLGRYLHLTILALIIGSVLTAAYLSAVASASSDPKVIWTTNPITIRFSHTTGQGSASDSFKCAPPVGGSVVLTSSNPILSVTPSAFKSCGPSFNDAITLNAHTSTIGTFHVVVTVSQLSLYKTIPPSLSVTIIVS